LGLIVGVDVWVGVAVLFGVGPAMPVLPPILNGVTEGLGVGLGLGVGN
jgi:hypothetical protein